MSPPLFQRPKPKSCCIRVTLLSTVEGIVIHGPASSSALDHLYFLGIVVGVGAPCYCSGGIFKLWAHNSFICSRTDTFMFCVDIAFDET